ncbi:MAG: hypothetical protein JJT75_09705 [Opitutales bacterium]|nr:hypothetical protein [Opitutales bacterium]MCH8540551.1 hypothetical protein [Opitutales bacterium]
MDESEIVNKLMGVFQNLGADKKQASVMARQLWKRAQQKADEENLALDEALNSLLKKAIDGRQGTFSG